MPSLKREVVETLRRVGSTGVTQVMVTHDVVLAREVADVVVQLERGAVVEDDSVSTEVAQLATMREARKT